MRLIIIGGVAAGMSAASKLRRLDEDAEIIVFEKGDDVSYGACGMPYYISGEIESADSLVARTPDAFRKKGIDVRTRHEVIAIDTERKSVTVAAGDEEKQYSYDKLLIATGARSLRLDVPGRDDGRIRSLKSLSDARFLKETLTDAYSHIGLIGGGYIGIEMAEALRTMGKRVTMIERESQVLPGFDADMASLVEDTLKAEGVTLKKQETVEAYEQGDSIRIQTDRDAYEVDFVIESIGVRPDTAFLEGTAIEMEKGAIKVDEGMETNVRDVYAAGDCALYPHRLLDEHVYVPLGTHANKTGRLLGERLGGLERTFDGVIGSMVLKAFELEVAKTGLTASEAETAGIPFGEVRIKAPSHAGYYPGAKPLHVKWVYHREDCRLLGAQLIGEAGAAHRVNIAATAIQAGMTARTFSQLDLAYAPPFSPVWDPLQIAVNQIKCHRKKG